MANKRKTLTYPNILVEHFNDDRGRINGNFIHVSPQNQVSEDQHLIPCRTPGLPDHTGVRHKVREDHTAKGICDGNMTRWDENLINHPMILTICFFSVY